MVWGPEKRAGFAVAALLGDDRALKATGPALEPELRERLTADLAGVGDRKAEAIARWLTVLRPALDDTALTLPPRVRALLAPLSRSQLKQALLGGAPAQRSHYRADQELIAVLLRIARKTARGRAP